jgi:NAD-dependent dihydropyrimidine dehydrogenase PreA subunit
MDSPTPTPLAPGHLATPSCKQPPGSIAPLVDLKRCEGKGDCVRVCPCDVFEIRRVAEADYRRLGSLNRFKLRVHGMKVAYTPNADACRSCGLCVSACPERAITLGRVTESTKGQKA